MNVMVIPAQYAANKILAPVESSLPTRGANVISITTIAEIIPRMTEIKHDLKHALLHSLHQSKLNCSNKFLIFTKIKVNNLYFQLHTTKVRLFFGTIKILNTKKR